ncbi:MAG TPA: OmpH family outer membrane protein [Rhizomicrobium sp.]
MRNLRLFSIALAGAAFSFLAVAAQAAPPPAPRILVVDRNAILANSRVGADIIRQLKDYRMQEEADLRGQAAQFQNDVKAFQQQAAILSAALRDQKAHALEARQAALQGLEDKRNTLIQGGLIKARNDVAVAIGPILKQIMAERGANLVLDKMVVIDSSINIDITPEVIQRLNQTMPTLKVQLVPPPPGMAQQQ